MSAPARLQILADKYLDLVPLNVRHTAVSAAELPRKQADGDEIGRKLDALGLGEPTTTPSGRGAREARRRQGAASHDEPGRRESMGARNEGVRNARREEGGRE